MKVASGVKNWKVYCKKAKGLVRVEEAPPETTAYGLCSFCGESIHYSGHEPPYKGEYELNHWDSKYELRDKFKGA